MTVGGIAGKYPIHDVWSNEGGGRIHEESQRYGARMGIQAQKEQNARTIKSLEGQAQAARLAFEHQQKVFAERYGSDALTRLTEGIATGAASPEAAKQMLVDATALEKAGTAARKAEDLLSVIKRETGKIIQAMSDTAELSASSYDSRFLADDEARLAAYNRMQATQARMIEFGEMSARESAARQAGKIAEMASLKEKLGPPSALYSVDGVGSIKIDFKALEKMGPGEEATAQLARLIGVLAERNGLGQLRDGLIGIVNGQNSRLAERAGG